jgi:hypothetical protein
MDAEGPTRSTDASELCTLDVCSHNQIVDASNAAVDAPIYPGVQAWCSALGMRPDVGEQWARWHVNPATAMAWFFTAQYEFMSLN